MIGKPAADMAALLAEAGWLRRFARALVSDADDADDLTQDTLARAMRNPGTAGRAWLATVARRLAVDRFRAGTRMRRRHEIAADDGRVASPEELIADAQIHRYVAEAVASLAEPFRQTLVLRFYQGLTSAEIARRLREPEGTIRWRVKEGLERVRRELDRRHDLRRGAWVAALAPLLPRVKKGYTLTYFGQLMKKGMVVYLWKVASVGAPEEALIRMAVKDGKVAGVLVQ